MTRTPASARRWTRLGALCFVAVLAGAYACRGALRFTDEGCGSDNDCPVSGMHCDTSSATCVACLIDTDCQLFGLHHCDRSTNQCVDCAYDAECGANNACRSNRCVTLCTEPGNSDPACPSGMPHCEGSLGFCVMCESDSACSKSTPHCEVGVCVECASDKDCAEGRCNPLGRCVECLDADDCAGGSGVCDPASGSCADL